MINFGAETFERKFWPMKKMLFAYSVLVCCLAADLAAQQTKSAHGGCNYITRIKKSFITISDSTPKAEPIVNEILKVAKMPQNFTLVSSEQEHILAFTAKNQQRYISLSHLFNQEESSIDKATKWEVYVLLAHEIGHHLRQHDLRNKNKKICEFFEYEADEFAGMILSRIGVPLSDALDAFNKTKNLSPKRSKGFLRCYDSEVRAARFIYGWESEKKSSPLGKSMGRGYTWGDVVLSGAGTSNQTKSNPVDPFVIYNNDADADGIPDFEDLCPYANGTEANKGCPSNPMPKFPWPPPQCFLRKTLVKNLAKQFKEFGEVDSRLQNTLDAHGYTQRSYFQAPGGFAMVTQLEQFDKKGKIIERCRWTDYPVQDFEGVWDYLTALVMPNPGYFRIFVFVVTNQEYPHAPRKTSKEEAAAWLTQGVNRLPLDFRKTTITNEHYLDVLIYEFEAPISTRKCAQKCPCLLDCQTHLMKSGLNNLGF